jgi:hypothetical protein
MPVAEGASGPSENWLLASLPHKDYERLRPNMDRVALDVRLLAG